MAKIEDIQKIQELTDSTGKTLSNAVSNAQDLDEVIGAIVDRLEDFSDFNDTLENSFRYYLKSLPDVQNNFKDIEKHWDTITNYVKDNLSDSKAYLGNIGGIRDILKDIVNQVQQPRSAINEQIRGLRNIRDLAIRVTDSLYVQGALEDRNLVKNHSKAQALEREYIARVKNLTGESLERGILESKQKLEELQLRRAERELAYHAKKKDYSSYQLRLLREEIDQHKINIELLSRENLLAVTGLTKNAELIRQLAREVGRENPLASFAAKIGNKLGIPEVGEHFKDYAQDRTRKKVGLEEARTNLSTLQQENQESLANRQSNIASKSLTLSTTVKDSVDFAQRSLDRNLGSESLDVKKQRLHNRRGENGRYITEEDAEAQLRVLWGLEQKLLGAKKEQKDLAEEIDQAQQEYSKAVQDCIKSEQDAKNRIDNIEKDLEDTRKSSLTLLKESLTEQIKTLGVQGIAIALALKVWNAFKQVNEEAAKLKQITGTWNIQFAAANTQFATTKDTLVALGELASSIKINPIVLFTPEEAGKMAEVKKLLGLSSDQAAALTINTKVAGTSAELYRKELTKGINEGNGLNRTAIALGTATREALSASNAITYSMGNNAERIGKAAVAAQALGLSLKDAESISKSLINFESSISAEMEAQLLTGHQLNLAKAREYALNNDLEGVMREIGGSGVTLAEYGRMSIIRQEKFAAALGMSRDQFANMLVQQHLSGNLSEEALRAATHMTEEQIEAATVAERWRTSIEKLQQAFSPILELLIPIVELTSRIVTSIAGFWKIFGGEKPGTKGIDRVATNWSSSIGSKTPRSVRKKQDKLKELTEQRSQVEEGSLAYADYTKRIEKCEASLVSFSETGQTGFQKVLTAAKGFLAMNLLLGATLPRLASGFRGFFGEIFKNFKTSIRMVGTLIARLRTLNVTTNSAGQVINRRTGQFVNSKVSQRYIKGQRSLLPQNLGTSAEKTASSTSKVGKSLKSFPSATRLFGLATAILAFGGAIALMGLGLKQVQGISIGKLAADLGIMVAGLVVGLGLIGAIATLPTTWAGIAAILAFGGAIALMGLGFKLATPAIEAFGNVLKQGFEGVKGLVSTVGQEIRSTFETLSNINWKSFDGCGKALIGLAAGIGVLGLSLMMLGPIKLLKISALVRTLILLGKAASGVSTLAHSIVSLGASINTLNTEKLDSLNNIKVGKLALATRVLGREERIKTEVPQNTTENQESSNRIQSIPGEDVAAFHTELDAIRKNLETLTSVVNAIDPKWSWVNFWEEGKKANVF